MAFAINRTGGVTDADLLACARLLRQKGADLGRLPRVPDTADGRWLPAWPTRAEAQAFADELAEQSGTPGWGAVETAADPVEGPLGPLVIQMAREAEGLTFAVHPLSRALVRSAFPEAVSATTYATIDPPAWEEFRRTKGGLAELVRQLIPALTGLDAEDADSLGFVAVDADTGATVAVAPPAVPSQA